MKIGARIVIIAAVLAVISPVIFGGNVSAYSASNSSEGWLDTFDLENCDFSSVGANDYFSLQPGYVLVLEGEEDGEPVQLTITVLNETKIVDGTETRVVEERQIEDGELVEVSLNYFVQCTQNGDIFYFGEITDIYEDGKVVGHEGSWESGVDGAKGGLFAPAKPEVGMKFYQEIAPGVAEDRAEIVSLTEVVDTPAGTFQNVLKSEETTPLEPGVVEYKYYSSEVGLIQDETLKLVKYVKPETVEEPPKMEFKSTVQPVFVEGNTIQVELNSSSTISEFKLDAESKRISFQAEGGTGSSGTTEISIGNILKGPYSVMIDGQATNDFKLIPSGVAGQDSIRVSYAGGSHNIIVSGTNVVPEFSVGAIWALAAIIGLGLILGRGKFVGGKMKQSSL